MPQVVDDQGITDADPVFTAENAAVDTLSSPYDGSGADGVCPPPLAWQEVLAEVSRGSESWRIERDQAVISGRSFGSGPPLFLLHGVLGNWELFALTMWLLRDEFQTIVLETSPLAGRLPGRRQTADALADDLLAAADHFSFRRCAVFASSFGGLVALSAMRQQPGRIERAILHAGCARIPLTFAERALLRIGRFCPGPLSRVPLFHRIQAENHRRWFPPFDPSRWDFLLRNMAGTKTSILASQLSALVSTDFRSVLPSLQAPVLLLQGEGEPQGVRDREAELYDGLPHVEHQQLPHCGHFPFVTHPHLLARALKEFLRPADDTLATDAPTARTTKSKTA